MTISRNKVCSILSNMVLICLSIYIMVLCKDVYLLCTLGTIITLILVGLYIFTYKKIFTPFLLFAFAFCGFTFGQFYLFTFKIKYDYVFEQSFYSNFFRLEDLIFCIKYTIISIELLFLGAFCVESDKNERVLINESSDDYKNLCKAAKLLFIVSFPSSLIMTVIQISITYFWGFGYSGLREGATGALLDKLDLLNHFTILYVPSLILLFILYRNSWKRFFPEGLMLVHAFAFFIIGQRTIALSLAVVFILLIFDRCKKIKLRYVIVLILGFFSLMFVSNYVALTRSNGNSNINILSLISQIVSSFLGELGFSCFSFLVLHNICPSEIPFAYGLSYVGALFSFAPSIIDPSGTLRFLAGFAGDQWLTDYIHMHFGIGYNLAAETYYNFGVLGLFAMAVISFIIAYIFCRPLKKTNLFGYYTKMVMLYALFTLPRRGLAELFNSLFFMIFIPWCLKTFVFQVRTRIPKS